jgi:hypothetical protein
VTTRYCRHQGCSARAKATLTFVYADRTAVLGPLSPNRAAEGIDLCPSHCHQLSVPRGWDIVRLPLDEPGVVTGPTDDLRALAASVRQAAGVTAQRPSRPPVAAPQPVASNVVTLAERRHLRVVADPSRSHRRQAG